MTMDVRPPSRDISVRFPNASFNSAVIERVVSAAAVQANLSVDQLTNALTSVETLVASVNRVIADDADRCFRISIADGRVEVAVVELERDQPRLIRDAADVAGIGNILAATATEVFELHDGTHSAIAVSIA